MGPSMSKYFHRIQCQDVNDTEETYTFMEICYSLKYDSFSKYYLQCHLTT